MTYGIGDVVAGMKAGKRYARQGWNGKGMWIYLVQPADKQDLPYVVMNTADNRRVPWLCSQTDLLANDWNEVANAPA